MTKKAKDVCVRFGLDSSNHEKKPRSALTFQGFRILLPRRLKPTPTEDRDWLPESAKVFIPKATAYVNMGFWTRFRLCYQFDPAKGTFNYIADHSKVAA